MHILIKIYIYLRCICRQSAIEVKNVTGDISQELLTASLVALSIQFYVFLDFLRLQVLILVCASILLVDTTFWNLLYIGFLHFL